MMSSETPLPVRSTSSSWPARATIAATSSGVRGGSGASSSARATSPRIALTRWLMTLRSPRLLGEAAHADDGGVLRRPRRGVAAGAQVDHEPLVGQRLRERRPPVAPPGRRSAAAAPRSTAGRRGSGRPAARRPTARWRSAPARARPAAAPAAAAARRARPCRPRPPARPARARSPALRSSSDAWPGESPSAFSARPRCLHELTLTSAASARSRFAVSSGYASAPRSTGAPSRRRGLALGGRQQDQHGRAGYEDAISSGGEGRRGRGRDEPGEHSGRHGEDAQPLHGQRPTARRLPGPPRSTAARPAADPTLPPRDLPDPSPAHHPVGRDSIVIAIAFAVLAFGGGAVLTCLVFGARSRSRVGIAAIVAAFVLCIIG